MLLFCFFFFKPVAKASDQTGPMSRRGVGRLFALFSRCLCSKSSTTGTLKTRVHEMTHNIFQLLRLQSKHEPIKMQTMSLNEEGEGEPVRIVERDEWNGALDHTHTHLNEIMKSASRGFLFLSFFPLVGSQTGGATRKKATVNTACCIRGGPSMALNYTSLIPQGL